jgi:integrase
MASIERRPDGKWRARWREYPGGPQRSKHLARKVDAERHLVEVQHRLLSGTYVDPVKARTTVRAYWTVWSARQPWRESSRSSITSVFEQHVLPAFGARPLGSVRRGDVEAWGARLPLAGTTARLAMQYLGTMFDAAVADGLLASNPARGAKRPRVEVEPVVPFTSDELDVLHEVAPAWFRVAVTLGAAAGLRQGEAAGLTIDRVDFLDRTLTVDRQLVTPGAGKPAFGPPKTARSFRRVPLADVALEQLARHVELHGTGIDGLVLHGHGTPVRRQRFGQVWRSMRSKAIKAIPEAVTGAERQWQVARWSEARFHDTRHTYASTLLSGGVSIAAAAEYLGHSPAVLLRTYAHLMPADHDRAREVVQAAFARRAEDFLRTTEASGTANGAVTSTDAPTRGRSASWAA